MKNNIIVMLCVILLFVGFDCFLQHKTNDGWEIIIDIQNDLYREQRRNLKKYRIREKVAEGKIKIIPQEELLESYYKEDKDVLVHISNQYGGGYYVQYFAGDHTVMGLRKDKSFPDLLDEIVEDIKNKDYGG